jgi:hypothetical protein
MAESDEEKEAGATVDDGGEGVHEIKKKVEVTEKVIETTPSPQQGHRFSNVEILILCLLALVVGFLLALVIPRLLDRLREREMNEFELPGPGAPEAGYYHLPYIPPPPLQPRRPRKPHADIDPQMIARTPPELRRHGIYLDELGEAVLTGPTIYETWNIERDEQGNIIDAHRVGQEE